ncbi:MAG: hypothetical protein K5905_23035 [Roseibium sp.]|uniref:sarcosine oxidase subunit gamma n=1 Tax=Roseibium sp. TaxID=1936156 RepID=UPI0026053B5E|nr:hypothetical protein [Roseibium sp.]MCV0428342.1 hypothetical protein [Roseibium sp.]
MAEVLSPLKSKCVAGHHGASEKSGLKMGTRALSGLWQIAGWDDFESAAQPVLSSLGLKDGGTFRIAQHADGATAWRIAPDRILIETADPNLENAPELMKLDLSHARSVITLEGPSSRDLLSQLVAIDVTPMAFKPGEFFQTGIHHVGVLIHCLNSDRFDILVPGTWASSVWEALYENALPHGVETLEVA